MLSLIIFFFYQNSFSSKAHYWNAIRCFTVLSILFLCLFLHFRGLPDVASFQDRNILKQTLKKKSNNNNCLNRFCNRCVRKTCWLTRKDEILVGYPVVMLAGILAFLLKFFLCSCNSFWVNNRFDVFFLHSKTENLFLISRLRYLMDVPLVTFLTDAIKTCFWYKNI